MIAGVPRQGGATWAVLQYLLGLRRLGCEVYFVEPLEGSNLEPQGTPLRASANAAYFREVMAEFGFSEASALLVSGTGETFGASYEELRRVARRADVLLNISGMLAEEELTTPIPVRVYLDLDPAFNQLWHATQGIDMRFQGHTHFVTVGQNIGHPTCTVPTCGLEWIKTWQPVVLEHWARGEGVEHDALTTVANWRGYGSIEHGGVFYGQKAHSLRKFIDLPTRTSEKFALALAIHPEEVRDIEALTRNGWRLLKPEEVADTPDNYRRFVRGSKAEFGIAKSGYVESRCGWFSDRSVCYLAAGRPVVAQETGFSLHLPTGAGLLSFETSDDALAAIEELRGDYARHSKAARLLAEEHFDSDKVLPRLLRNLGAEG